VIVVDASAVVDALAATGPGGDRVAAELWRHDRLLAPEHLHIEAAQGVRRLWMSGKLDSDSASDVLSDLESLVVTTVPVVMLLERAWELRHNLTMTDGAYVALAEQLGLPLVTTDLRIGRAAGVRCPVVHP
jgi:predicted nucleic acid-binding protein